MDERSGISGPTGRVGKENRGRTGAPYWKYGHRGYCWGTAFIMTEWWWPQASREQREDLAIDLLGHGQVPCECDLGPPGNRPLVW